MNAYQKEQLDALLMIRQHLTELSGAEIDDLKNEIADYLEFRCRVADFLEIRFKEICTEKCYQNRLSACCSKDGIIAFWGDLVVNALTSEKEDLDHLVNGIQTPANASKCIFLAKSGCLWQVKPIVCEMFLCDEAENRVFGNDPGALQTWEDFKEEKKRFTWPDRPVLFEKLEQYFIDKGCDSSLMYIHKSPGLMRIKRNRGIEN